MRTHLPGSLTAEGLVTERAGEVGGGRGHPLAVAGLGAERTEAALACLLGGHGCEELRSARRGVRFAEARRKADRGTHALYVTMSERM